MCGKLLALDPRSKAMALDGVLQRFIEECPVAVMARLTLGRAIGAEWVDEVFDQHRERQYTRELLFSTVVDLMALVAMGLRPSLHAAAASSKDLKVSMAALYEKVNHVEPAVLQALVQGSAERLAPVVARLREGIAPVAPGYRVRIVDGNHLPASQKRLAPLRGFRGAAMPGQSLVVFDPDLGLVVDLEPREDAHVQERTLLPAVLARAHPGDLWIGDRNFSTRAAIAAMVARGAAFLLREHGASPNPTPTAPRREVGRIETGMAYEQPVTIETDTGETLALRRIELALDQPTEDGDTVIRLLTNLPEDRFDTCQVARLYRRRWTIENLFQRLESVLKSEVRTLGYPRAALFAFSTAVLAYNVLATIQATVEAQHDLAAAHIELSSYFVAGDVKVYYAGMMVALPPSSWTQFEAGEPAKLSLELRRIAAYVDPRTLRKHPRKPKPKVKKGYAPRASVQRHVATARVLAQGVVL
jgi:IS4 transposase